MKGIKRLLPLLCVAAAPILAQAGAAYPPANPYLAASAYPVTHANYLSSALPGPTAPTHRLGKDEIQWKGVGPVNHHHSYSGPYPNGKRVIWFGGYDRIAKYDADTLQELTALTIGGRRFYNDEAIERHVATMNRLKGDEFVHYNRETWAGLFKYLSSFYRMLSKDNELYMVTSADDGSQSVQVYGEKDSTDPASPIEFRREWKVPAEVSKARILGMNMTFDGTVIILAQDGVVIALARDLKQYQILRLPNLHPEIVAKNNLFFEGFVRNGLSTDERGGIYIVTRDYMHRVQWTPGKFALDEADGAQRTKWIPGKLSLDESDGGWSVSYPNNSGIGSGTTPSLMGWGPNEDHLVIITDGTKGNNFMAFWRDEIPADWKGIPGFDRRVAGITPLHFGGDKIIDQAENSIHVLGYSGFTPAVFPENPVKDQGDPTANWFAGVLQGMFPGHELRGGEQVRWNPKTRELKTSWQTRLNLLGGLCIVSAPSEMLYCHGARNGEMTIEGIDWNTGKSAFHYTLGKDFRYSNLIGANLIISPNGVLDIDSTTGWGMTRLTIKGNPAKKTKP